MLSVSIISPPTIAEGFDALSESLGAQLLAGIERDTGMRFLHAHVNRQWYPREALNRTVCLRGKCVNRTILEAMPGGKQINGNACEIVPVVMFQIPRFQCEASYLFPCPKEVQREYDVRKLDPVDPHTHMSLNNGIDNLLAKTHPSLTFWVGEDGKLCYSHIYTLPGNSRRVIDIDMFEGVRGHVWYVGTPKKTII